MKKITINELRDLKFLKKGLIGSWQFSMLHDLEITDVEMLLDIPSLANMAFYYMVLKQKRAYEVKKRAETQVSVDLEENSKQTLDESLAFSNKSPKDAYVNMPHGLDSVVGHRGGR